MSTYRPPIVYGEVHVGAVEQIAARVRRIELTGDVLQEYRPDRPAEAFRLMLPPPGADRVDFPHTGPDGLPAWRDDQQRPSLRGQTVRRAESGRIWFDVVERDTVTWPSQITSGDLVGMAGMRFGFAGADAASAVLVGDRSAIPALSAIVDGSATTPCHVILVGEIADDELALLPERAARVIVEDHTVIRTEIERLTQSVQHLFVAGEVRIAASAHAAGRELLGLAETQIQPVVYSERGLTADERDPLVFQRYQDAARDGRDVSDPTLVADLELTPLISPA